MKLISNLLLSITSTVTLGSIVAPASAAYACDPRQEILSRGPASTQWIVVVDQSVDRTFANQAFLRGSRGLGPHLYDVVAKAGLRKNQVGAVVAFGEVGQEQIVAFYLPVPTDKVTEASKGYSRIDAYCRGTIFVASPNKERVGRFAQSGGSSRPWSHALSDSEVVGAFWSTHESAAAMRFQDNIVNAAGDSVSAQRVREWLALPKLREVSGMLYVKGDRFNAEVSGRYDGPAPRYAGALIRTMGLRAGVIRKDNILKIQLEDLTSDQIISAVQRFP
ncbi:MAG: hypothetical protein AAF449_07575 [Myxococcota bacterium]